MTSDRPAGGESPATREELYRSIYTHDTIYIPPHEETSGALEVALGCSWHRCAFCDFAKDDFRLIPLEEVERRVQVLARLQPEQNRLFLLGENPFCMDTDRLLAIRALIGRYMPRVEALAMYARADDVLRKTPGELATLAAAGVRALHIGVESGCDGILLRCEKGVTAAQTTEALLRLDAAGIDYFVTVIPGLGGREYSRLHAVETARMLNRTHPKNIWCLKLHLYPGTPLYRQAQAGHFTQMDPWEVLAEEELMLRELAVTDCLFEDTTVLDQYTIRGMLPDQKQQLLSAVDLLLRAHAAPS